MSWVSRDKFKKDREIQREIRNTETKKRRFIDQIKNGLGTQIRKNPEAFIKLSKPNKTPIQKILEIIKRLFKAF